MLYLLAMWNKKIAIVGSGNVASHLARVFTENNIEISAIYSRNSRERDHIAKENNIYILDDIKNIADFADIIFLASADDSIASLAMKIKQNDKIVVHCSGIAETQLLSVCTANYACFYPLQTFTKQDVVDFRKIPILITASNFETEKILQELAHKIADSVTIISDLERQKIHLAAVIVNNFTNHLFTLSANYLAKNNIDFDLLKPLIQETVHKITKNHPISNQTGPAKRNDKNTIEKHFSLIADEDLLEIYKILTKSIYKTHNA